MIEPGLNRIPSGFLMNKLYGMHRIEHEEDYSGLNKDFTVVNQINRFYFRTDHNRMVRILIKIRFE